MSVNIPVAFVKEYSGNIIQLAQQKGSRLREFCRDEPVSSNMKFVDRIGATEVVAKTGRHTGTPPVDVPHSRRRLNTTPYVWKEYIDSEDQLRTLIDIKSGYVQSGAMAMGRQMDRSIIASLGGDAYEGVDGGTTVALPSAQKIAASNTSLTIAKILEAKEILDAAETDPDAMSIMGVTAQIVTDLLNTTEIKDTNYNTVKALAAGEIDTFCKFKFIRTQLFTKVSTERTIFAFKAGAIVFGVGNDIQTKIDVIPQLDYTTQVFFQMDIGAVRVEDAQVVQIGCIE
jgi:hypothetical protein